MVRVSLRMTQKHKHARTYCRNPLYATFIAPFFAPSVCLSLLTYELYIYILILGECVRSLLPCSSDSLPSKYVQHLLVLLSSEKEASRAYI